MLCRMRGDNLQCLVKMDIHMIDFSLRSKVAFHWNNQDRNIRMTYDVLRDAISEPPWQQMPPGSDDDGLCLRGPCLIDNGRSRGLPVENEPRLGCKAALL